MGTCLVTGAAGQDGILLCRHLLAAGDRVVGLVLPGDEVRLQRWAPGAESVAADVTDADAMARLLRDLRPDRLAHLAGSTSVARSWADPVEAVRVNVDGTQAMLEAVRALGDNATAVSTVVAVSGEVFGDVDGACDETTPVRPASPYALSKAAALQLVDVYRRGYSLRASAAILFNHESPLRGPGFVTRKITMGVAAIARGRADSLTLGNLDVRRDWGWAPDYVRGIAAMLLAELPGDYVLATGRAHSVADFLTAAFARVGIEDWRPYVAQDPALLRPVDSATMIGNASRARRELDWRTTLDFGELVAAMVDHDLAALDAGDPGLVWCEADPTP